MAEKEGNKLFPVFLKLENRNVLIVGGGKIALEKLNAVLQNSPGALIKIIAESICKEIKYAALSNPSITLIEKKYECSDINEDLIIISAINDPFISKQISNDARKKGIWINVADQPDLCDFYLGSVVKKGNLKVAISTNGKSPTVAKRLKDIFSDLLPEEIDEVLQNLHIIRNKLNINFSEKVNRLNAITRELAAEKEEEKK